MLLKYGPTCTSIAKPIIVFATAPSQPMNWSTRQWKVGVTALALTNINSTCDAWDFVKHCREAQIKPILGVEIRN
jgi:DNA polymerase III alpha subunit